MSTARWAVFFLHSAFSILHCAAQASLPSTQPETPAPPNVLVILADDMRFDELQFMPFTAARACESALFEHAFVSTPLCCPARSAIYSGGFYAQHTGVLTNENPDGAVFAFHDGDTLATRLQAAGWRTGLIGKYMNLYKFWCQSHPGLEIPPGWGTFAAGGNQSDWSDWQLMEGSSTPTAAGDGTAITLHSYPDAEIAARCIDFLGGAEPWVLMACFLAPHAPAMPPDADQCRLAEFAFGGGWVYRGRGWGEDVGDKPQWVQTAGAEWWAGQAGYYTASQPFVEHHVTPDDQVADRLRCLLALDRQVQRIFEEIEALGLLERTIVVFAADNGFMLGEHRLHNKGVPYEEAVRVPLFIWYAGIAPRRIAALVSMDVDLPCTIMDWCGLPQFSGTDGQSLRGILETGASGRAAIYTQFWPDNDDRQPGWTAVRDANRKLVIYDTAESEFYDLANDPFELSNAAGDGANAAAIAALGQELSDKRGLSLKTQVLPVATRNVAYSVQLSAWGGTAPYTWSKYAGTWPPGLSMSAAGLLHGTPPAAGNWTVTLRVTDSSTSPQHGGPQRASRQYLIVVAP